MKIKKFVVLLVILLLLLATTVPVFAKGGLDNWAEECKYFQPDTFADCMKGPGSLWCWSGGFKNHGQCVKYFMSGQYK